MVLVDWPGGEVLRTFDGPLEALRWLDGQRERVWTGYLAYELGEWFERLPAGKGVAGRGGVPLLAFAEAGERAETGGETALPVGAGEAVSNLGRAGFERAVGRALEYICAGDVFQVNLAHQLRRAIRGDAHAVAAAVYARLLAMTPARFGALLTFPAVPSVGSAGFAVVSNSPELFLHVTPDGGVSTRPIKGTRPRTQGMHEELLGSEKDRAELAMIVDLMRNDLGRVCRTGSVRVSVPRQIETHPTVYHGVAEITGRLGDGVGLVELLRAVFPCGSVTGCPKIRAMEIIHELEPEPRGVYCGSVCVLHPSGRRVFSVAIRTMTVRAGELIIPVGGGVVADSTPAGEWEETLVKAHALLKASE